MVVLSGSKFSLEISLLAFLLIILQGLTLFNQDATDDAVSDINSLYSLYRKAV